MNVKRSQHTILDFLSISVIYKNCFLRNETKFRIFECLSCHLLCHMLRDINCNYIERYIQTNYNDHASHMHVMNYEYLFRERIYFSTATHEGAACVFINLP